MVPAPSPTTTRVEKLKFFPPFTTLVTRLTATTCSFKFRLLASMGFWSRTFSSNRALLIKLELQTRLSGGLGQRLDPPVVLVAPAVEDHRGEARLAGALPERLAHRLGGGRIAAVGERGPQLLVARRGRDQRASRRVVHDLRVDVLVRAEDAQARPRRPALHPLAQPAVNALAVLGAGDLGHRLARASDVGSRGSHGYLVAVAAALPAFLRSSSPTNRIPFCLYGSGGRRERISLATCPTSCLSIPLTATRVCFSMLIWMPSGMAYSTGWE